jgi:hypothetical protein
MPDTVKHKKQIQSPKFNVVSVLATSIYVATALVILAYFYQSFIAFF